MGNDYYVTNEHLVFPDGHTQAAGEIFGYYVITSQYYRRYKLPIMHTETNIKMPACKEWLLKQWANVHRLKHDGIPIIGFTWFCVNQLNSSLVIPFSIRYLYMVTLSGYP